MNDKDYGIKFDDGRYVDNIGRNVIIDRFNKCFYIVPKHENKRYNIMRSRVAFAIAIGMALIFFVSLPIGLIGFVVSFIIGEILYRGFFLKKLQKVTGTDLPLKPTLLERYAVDNDGTLILICILSIVLLVMLPIYIMQEVGSISDALQFKNLNWSIIVYGSIALCVLAVYLIYSTIIVLIGRRKK